MLPFIHVYYGDPAKYEPDNDFDFLTIFNDNGDDIEMIKPDKLDPDVPIYNVNNEKEAQELIKDFEKYKIINSLTFQDIMLTCQSCELNIFIEDNLKFSLKYNVCENCIKNTYKHCKICRSDGNHRDIYICEMCNKYICRKHSDICDHCDSKTCTFRQYFGLSHLILLSNFGR